jgi:hypothetical protein
MAATIGEYAPGSDAGGERRDQLSASAAEDVLVVVDAGRPTAVRWRDLLLPVTHAVRWHERPVIPWWRSQRRLDLDQALALVDQERWRLQAEVLPSVPTLRAVPTYPRQGGDLSRRSDRHDGLGADLEAGFADDFGCDYEGDYSGDFDEGSQDLDNLEVEQPRSEPVTISVEVLRAGDDWHVLRVEGP